MRLFYPLMLMIAGISVLLLIPTKGQSTDYTYHGGYYWYGNKAYSREKIYYPQTYSYQYDSYGRQQYVPNAQTYYYLYTEIPTVYPPSIPTTYPPTPTPSTNPTPQKAYDQGYGWRQQLLEIAKARDVAEHAMRKADLDHKSYLEALSALGMAGNFRLPGYGSYSVQPHPAMPYASSPVPYGSYNPYGVTSSYNTVTSSYGYPAQGATTYGYSVNNLRDQGYGTTDLNTLYQQASRLAQNSQTLSGQATADFQGLAGQAGDNAARVAEILAKAQAASIALQAANATPSTRTSTTSSATISGSSSNSSGFSGSTGGTNVDPNIPNPAPAPPAMVPADGGARTTSTNPQAFLAQVGIPRCGKCHSGANVKGSFNVANYTQLTPDQKRGVWQKILSSDPKVVMPPPPEKTLNAAELQAFLMN